MNCCTDGKCENSQVKNVSTSLSFKDILDGWKARWGINRMNYTVTPDLYTIGEPNSESPVLVSANYKLTFDILRKNLKELDCWLLILDTKGINVWCAAGKGTFGTDELIHRIKVTELHKYINHKTLILPQLGATGVCAYKIAQEIGYHVLFGPVRAEDIKPYIKSNNVATKEMRTVNFTLYDRLVLTPMELVPAINKSFPIVFFALITNLFIRKPFDKKDFLGLLGAIFSGSVLTPVMLPYIPGKSFSVKGGIVGFFCTLLNLVTKPRTPLLSTGHLLLFPAISSYLAMNFTGSSTYTSPSGVQKEMKKSLPFIVGGVVVGGLLTIGYHLFSRREKR